MEPRKNHTLFIYHSGYTALVAYTFAKFEDVSMFLRPVALKGNYTKDDSKKFLFLFFY